MLFARTKIFRVDFTLVMTIIENNLKLSKIFTKNAVLESAFNVYKMKTVKNQIYKDLKSIIISYEDLSVFFPLFQHRFQLLRKRHLLAKSSFDRFYASASFFWLVSVDYGGYNVDDGFLKTEEKRTM